MAGGLAFTLVLACASNPKTAPGGLTAINEMTLQGANSFLDGYSPLAAEGAVQVIIEIPTGTNAKWEVTKPDGLMRWKVKKGKPRVVHYLSYPGNYGMVPRTLLPEEEGGDGDPLDVLVLGPAVPRGSVMTVRLLGVLRLLDRGEQDDKLIALPVEGAVMQAGSLEELEQNYPGVRSIIETWFVRYKGPGKMESQGYGDAAEARAILERAIAAFQKDHP